MSMLGAWHRDYVAESIKRFEQDPFHKDPSFAWLSQVAPGHAGIADHARTIAQEAGDAHGAAVAESVRNIAQGAAGRSGRMKFSSKQGFVVGRILAERYGTARALVRALFDMTDEEIDHADV